MMLKTSSDRTLPNLVLWKEQLGKQHHALGSNPDSALDVFLNDKRQLRRMDMN